MPLDDDLDVVKEAAGKVMDPRQVDLVVRYADMLQVGARNMQNFDLLKECGRTRTPTPRATPSGSRRRRSRARSRSTST